MTAKPASRSGGPQRRRAVLRHELVPRRPQRIVEHELGRIRQPIADFHQRQRPQAIGHRDAKDRRALKHANRVEHRFGVAFAHAERQPLEQRGELRARRRRIEDAVVEQLVEQQRLLGDLPREPRAARDERQQPIESGRILVEQREIGAAPPHGAKYRYDTLEATSARRDGRPRLPAFEP